ncbi:uncharacterized protein LOC141812709 [Curcuma longa]|uniref:uncharacterized protein LOC141812709 n=1 Tax=Curcuma longa TaxID=136217 RepID=UPI003D9E2352
MVSSSSSFVVSSAALLTERSSISIPRRWSKARAMPDRCAVGGRGGASVEISHGFQCLDGIRSIAESGRFKAWLLDQFGVLHDGKKPYPGAISTLKKLADQGAKLVVISNSSRRACITIEKLKSLGFDPSVFSGAITSGELTHQYLLRLDACI